MTLNFQAFTDEMLINYLFKQFNQKYKLLFYYYIKQAIDLLYKSIKSQEESINGKKFQVQGDTLKSSLNSLTTFITGISSF